MDKSKNNKALLFLPLVILVIGLAGISFIKSTRASSELIAKNPQVIKVYQGGQMKEITDQSQCNSIISLIGENLDTKKLNSSERKGLSDNKDLIESIRNNESAVEIIYDSAKTLELSGSPLQYTRLFFQVSNSKTEKMNGIVYGEGPEYISVIEVDTSKIQEKLKDPIAKAFK